MTLTRGTIITFVVFHLFCILGEASYYAMDFPGYQTEERDRRLCLYEPPPDWCFVPEIVADTQYQEFEQFGRGVDNPGDLTGLVGQGWGTWQILTRLLFMNYDIFDARGPLGLVGVAMRWIALASIAAAIVGIVIGILTRR